MSPGAPGTEYRPPSGGCVPHAPPGGIGCHGLGAGCWTGGAAGGTSEGPGAGGAVGGAHGSGVGAAEGSDGGWAPTLQSVRVASSGSPEPPPAPPAPCSVIAVSLELRAWLR